MDDVTKWAVGVLILTVCVSACSSSETRARAVVTTTIPAPPTTRRPTTTTSVTTVPPTTTTTTPVAAAQSYRVVVEEHHWQRGARVLDTRVYRPNVAGRFPMFVWAHGFEATVDYFDPLLRFIATHGFIVAAPAFPLTRKGAPGGSVYNDYVNQPADVSFVITRMLAAYPRSVDAALIAVGGHSLGAVTTMGLVSNRCCVDDRVRAAIEVDGSTLRFPNGAVDERGVPVLLIHGDADRTFSVNDSRATYARSRAPKYLLILPGVGHVPFDIPSATAVIETAMVDFLNATLRQLPSAKVRIVRDATESQT
jgi:predicted dienelactone hydrolase